MQILAGLALGMAAACEKGLAGGSITGAVLEFWGCVTGTCAAFYVFFLCRMLGAGDIKLMALCTGFLGIRNGILVIFLSLLSAAAYGSWKLLKRGIFWEKMSRLAYFVIQAERKGKLEAYPERREENSLRLGPFLWLGYCTYLLMMA